MVLSDTWTPTMLNKNPVSWIIPNINNPNFSRTSSSSSIMGSRSSSSNSLVVLWENFTNNLLKIPITTILKTISTISKRCRAILHQPEQSISTNLLLNTNSNSSNHTTSRHSGTCQQVLLLWTNSTMELLLLSSKRVPRYLT